MICSVSRRRLFTTTTRSVCLCWTPLRTGKKPGSRWCIELAHALADQHHNLGKYMREGSPDDDASTARQAVMEGQATWLSWAYLFWSRNGRPEIPQSRLDELANSAGADGPVYSSAPLYIQESLVFPYNHGILFMDAVFRKLGRAAFDEVFSLTRR